MSYDQPNSLKGLRFPFSVSDVSGRSEVTEFSAQIESSLLMLIVTEKGSRPMLRDYGLGIRQLVQEPNDEVLQNLFRRLAYEEIIRWEPRIVLNEIDFAVNEEVLHIYLRYVLVETGSERVSDFTFPIT